MTYNGILVTLAVSPDRESAAQERAMWSNYHWIEDKSGLSFGTPRLVFAATQNGAPIYVVADPSIRLRVPRTVAVGKYPSGEDVRRVLTVLINHFGEWDLVMDGVEFRILPEPAGGQDWKQYLPNICQRAVLRTPL